MSVCELYTQSFARNWRCRRFAQRVLREDQKERHCHDSREMVELINSYPAVLDALVTCDENWIYCYDPEWKHAGSPRPKKARQRKFTHKLLMIPFFFGSTGMIYMNWVPTGQTVNKEYYVEVLREFRKRFRRMRGVGGVRKSIHQSWLAKQLGLGLLCWGFKEVQEEIPSKDASTLQIGSVAFPPGQCTSPQLHPCHRLFDQDGHQHSSSTAL